MKTVAPLFLVRGAACLILAGSAMAEQAVMRDVATHDQLSEKLRVANNKGPLSDFKPVEGEDPTKVKHENILDVSDFLAFSGHCALVPKHAVLFIPPAMAERVKRQDGAILQTWPDFYAGNRSWITTVEVSRAQAQGDQPLAEDLVKRMQKGTNVVVATYQGGPISVLPPKVPAPAEADKKVPAQTANSKKP
jgi:hypothetical protein